MPASSKPEEPAAPIPPAVTGGHLASLDLFRGATIAAMILVNIPGNEDAAYWPLKHAEWNGWTPTDLIFPFFLFIFIVGVSLVFSFESRLKRGDSRTALLVHTFRRSAIIAAIGLALNALFAMDFHLLRIPGVLQRIALCYLVAAILFLYLGRRGRAIVVGALLLGYWILMCFVPVPGFGLPGRDVPLLHPDWNLAAYLDRKLIFGQLYEGTRDPEGLLSSLPAIATALLGVFTGEWLRSKNSSQRKALWMLVPEWLASFSAVFGEPGSPSIRNCGRVPMCCSPRDSLWYASQSATGLTTSSNGAEPGRSLLSFSARTRLQRICCILSWQCVFTVSMRSSAAAP